VSIGKELIASQDVVPIVLGGPDDAEAGRAFQAAVGERVVNLAGLIKLGVTAAVLKRCVLYIGGDTGPMHLAAACKTSVLCISCHPRSGSSEHANAPRRFGPWQTVFDVLQPESASPPCVDGCDSSEAHCILQLSVETVARAAHGLLSRAGSPADLAKTD
jgi:heptosyltransferase-2